MAPASAMELEAPPPPAAVLASTKEIKSPEVVPSPGALSSLQLQRKKLGAHFMESDERRFSSCGTRTPLGGGYEPPPPAAGGRGGTTPVNIRGEPIADLSRTGGWAAAFFIFGNEVAERMAYFGLSVNMVVFMFKVMHRPFASSANAVNNFLGISQASSVLGGFLADAYLGRYWTVAVFTTLYLLGLVALTVSASVPALVPSQAGCDTLALLLGACAPAERWQMAYLETALYVTALGAAGIRPCVSSFGADQFDERSPGYKRRLDRFFNLFYPAVTVGAIAFTAVVYIQMHRGWAAAFGALALAMGASNALFFVGTPLYRHRLPGARGQPAHAGGAGPRRRLQEAERRLRQRPLRGALRGRRRQVRHPGQRQDRPHRRLQVARQGRAAAGGGRPRGRRRRGPVAPVHGDAGGGGEDPAAAAAGAGVHGDAQRGAHRVPDAVGAAGLHAQHPRGGAAPPRHVHARLPLPRHLPHPRALLPDLRAAGPPPHGRATRTAPPSCSASGWASSSPSSPSPGRGSSSATAAATPSATATSRSSSRPCRTSAPTGCSSSTASSASPRCSASSRCSSSSTRRRPTPCAAWAPPTSGASWRRRSTAPWTPPRGTTRRGARRGWRRTSTSAGSTTSTGCSPCSARSTSSSSSTSPSGISTGSGSTRRPRLWPSSSSLSRHKDLNLDSDFFFPLWIFCTKALPGIPFHCSQIQHTEYCTTSTKHGTVC